MPDTESNVTKSEITKSNNEIMAEKNPDVKDSNSNSDDTGYTSNQLEQGKDTKNEELERHLILKRFLRKQWYHYRQACC